ncbi:MAG: hypothetical protein JXQ91_02555 [Vannielia sp.]|uniref:hypothetical protein n=1 Tax=Vannielia sp. TaxID=2813045 RepID=UPI003B8E18A6
MSPALRSLALAASLTLSPLAATAQSGGMIQQSDPEHVARIAGVLTGMGFQVSDLGQDGPWGFLAEYKGSKVLVQPVSCQQGKPCNFLRIETRYGYDSAFDAADIEDFNRRAWCCKMVQVAPGKVHMSMTLPFNAPMTEAYLRESLAVQYSMHNTAWDMLTEWYERGPATAAVAPSQPATPPSAPPTLGISPAEIEVSGAAPSEAPKLGVGVGSFSADVLLE